MDLGVIQMCSSQVSVCSKLSHKLKQCVRWPTCCKSFEVALLICALYGGQGRVQTQEGYLRHFSSLVTAEVTEGKPSPVSILQLCLYNIEHCIIMFC